MSIRTKLLLAFLSLSILVVVVGMTFYIQLKNLIEPLTPQSIPQSIDQLSEQFDKNDLIFRLLYQQLTVEKSLDNYVLTQNQSALQNYYLDAALLDQLKQNVQTTDSALWKMIESTLQEKQTQQDEIISLMKNHDKTQAIQLLTNDAYLQTGRILRTLLTQHYFHVSTIPNETAVVTVKLASKNTTRILQNSLNTTLIIFFDAIILSILMAIASVHAISSPIQSLRNAIESMRKKDALHPLDPPLTLLSGEVGDLARSFDALMTRLTETTVSRDELLIEVERRKISEQALYKTASELEEKNKELDQFAYSVSHDLRAPLRGIENLSKWIEEDCYEVLTETSRNHFDLLKKRVKRLDALITGILEYSIVGTSKSHLEAVSITKILIEAIDNLAPPPHIAVNIEGNLPTIITSKVAITQVFLNLISNAIKYNDKPQGQIMIGCITSDNVHQFYVSDNGPGIHPQFHNKIFLIFQTLHSRDVGESSGIGLAMVKKIVETYGGKVWLKSALGEGSTFYFTWPKNLSN